MKNDGFEKVRIWTAEPLSQETIRILSRTAKTEGICDIAVMPDVHPSEGVCVGTAFASVDRIFPEATGSDIGCGMATVRLRATAHLFDDDIFARKVLMGLGRLVPPDRHPLGTQSDWLPYSLLHADIRSSPIASALKRDGRVQFGTLGRGNHFLELQADEHDQLWVLVHSGSRGMGPVVAKTHRPLARPSNTGLLYFDASSKEGDDYLADMYARENRLRIIDSVLMLLDELCGVTAERTTFLDSTHNFIRKEKRGAIDMFVHRKGANSAFEGEPSVIPGSMGTASFHGLGRGNEEALNSCSHGAGRAMSRSFARHAVTEKRLNAEMKGVHFNRQQARLLLDEAPSAYKNIDIVMRAQKELVKQIRKLRPVLNYKGVS